MIDRGVGSGGGTLFELLCYVITSAMTSIAPISVASASPVGPADASPGHGHDHGHGDAHRHDHAHTHAHAHVHAPTPAALPRPGWSLVRASLVERLALAGGVSGAIWLGVAWALRPIG